MGLPTYLLTESLDLAVRIEMARHDARTGRLSATEAVEFAAEVTGVDPSELESLETRVGELEEEVRDAERELDDLGEEADGLKEAVRELVARMADPGVADRKAALAAAAKELRRLFGLKGGR